MVQMVSSMSYMEHDCLQHHVTSLASVLVCIQHCCLFVLKIEFASANKACNHWPS